jgi:hypothetical protein
VSVLRTVYAAQQSCYVERGFGMSDVLVSIMLHYYNVGITIHMRTVLRLILLCILGGAHYQRMNRGRDTRSHASGLRFTVY